MESESKGNQIVYTFSKTAESNKLSENNTLVMMIEQKRHDSNSAQQTIFVL